MYYCKIQLEDQNQVDQTAVIVLKEEEVVVIQEEGYHQILERHSVL